MAHSNNVISAPVDIVADIRTVSRQTSHSLNALSNGEAVNKWSLCKPMSVALVGAEPVFYYSNEARMALYKKVCYGLTNIPCFSRAAQMTQWMKGNTASTYPTNYPWMTKGQAWAHRKATIGRAFDWVGYNHFAQPIVLNVPTSLEIPFAGTVYVDVELGYTGITVQDLCQQGVLLPYGSVQHSEASNPTDLRLGFCFIKSGTSSQAAMVVAPQYAYEYSGEFSFSFLASQFSSVFSAPAGTYTAFMFLGAMDVMPTGLVSVGNQTGVFYPINCSEVQMKITNRASDLTVSIFGTKDTAGQRDVKFNFNIINRSNYGAYINITIYLVQGDAEMVLDSWYVGGRKYLAPRGQDGDAYSVTNGSLDAKGLSSDLKVKAVIDVFETETSAQAIEQIVKTSAVTIGSEIPLPNPEV